MRQLFSKIIFMPLNLSDSRSSTLLKKLIERNNKYDGVSFIIGTEETEAFLKLFSNCKKTLFQFGIYEVEHFRNDGTWYSTTYVKNYVEVEEIERKKEK